MVERKGELVTKQAPSVYFPRVLIIDEVNRILNRNIRVLTCNVRMHYNRISEVVRTGDMMDS